MTPERLEQLRGYTENASRESFAIDEACELLEYTAQLEAQAGAAVVVPEIDGSCHSRLMLLSEARELGEISPLSAREICVHMAAVETARAWFCNNFASIPANRVLGEGQIAVDRKEWEAIQGFAAVWFSGRPDSEIFDASSAWHAIRPQAGGEG